MAASASSTGRRTASRISSAATRSSNGTESGSTLVLPHSGGSAADLARSLAKLKEISPDLVMSSGFVGEVAYREVTREEWAAVLDDRIAALASSP